MSETKNKFLPGVLMLIVAVLIMSAATFVARPTTAPSYVLSGLGLMCLCLGALSLWRARQRK
jgi:hypothetical protein